MEQEVVDRIKKQGQPVVMYAPYRKTIGFIYCGVFIKPRLKYKHYFRQMKSYGIQETEFQALLARGVKKIICNVVEQDGESPAVGDYISDITDWIVDTRTADRGHGLQRFCPVYRMAVIGEGAK